MTKDGALVEEYQYDINGTRNFEYGDGRTPVALVKEGVKYYLLYDQVGSLRLVADAGVNVVKKN